MKSITFNTFLLAILTTVACKESKQKLEEKKQVCISDSMQTRITLDTAKLSNISNQLQLSGEVGFNENKVVKVFSFTSGQVLEVKVSIGDKVTAGQVLAIVKSADIAGNYSDLKTTNSDIAIAKRQMDNVKLLFEKGISSEKEFEEVKENYQKALTANKKIEDALKDICLCKCKSL